MREMRILAEYAARRHCSSSYKDKKKFAHGLFKFKREPKDLDSSKWKERMGVYVVMARMIEYSVYTTTSFPLYFSVVDVDLRDVELLGMLA